MYRCPTLLTIRVQLIRIERQPAVVFIIRDAIVVVIMVTGVTFAILVMVSLVGVGNIRAVVQVVLVSILINVLIAVALVSHAVII